MVANRGRAANMDWAGSEQGMGSEQGPGWAANRGWVIGKELNGSGLDMGLNREEFKHLRI